VSAGAKVLRPDQLPVVERGGGARTVRLVSRACGSTALLNGITTFEGGAAIPLHLHDCEESVLVLEGRAVAEIGSERHEVGPDDVTWVPAGVPHRFLNASSTEPLRIFWTYASVDATRTLVATGETRTIDDEHA
jgi:putative monooxygenase